MEQLPQGSGRLPRRASTVAALAGVIGIAPGAACSPARPPAAAPAPRPSFVPPQTIGDCPDRLVVHEEHVDLGAPYPSWMWLPLEHALGRDVYIVGDVLVLFVPELTHKQQVTALRALRYDFVQRRWLPEAQQPLGGHPAAAPRYSELDSAELAAAHVIVWTDLATRRRRGLHFTSASGHWREASPGEVAAAQPRSGLATHAAYPDNPETITGVRIAVDPRGPDARFTDRHGVALGTIRFPSLPGSYIGAFTNTRTALFWSTAREADQRRLPAARRFDSYLVNLESGATCRIARELAYPGTSVFRAGERIVMVNALRTETRRSDCPPGAPCVAPEQSHFRGASIVVLSDRGAP